jgi:small redox-active disulfide protein 2
MKIRNRDDRRKHMKQVKILGTGCANCRQLEAAVREAVGRLGIEAEIEKVEDMEKIMSFDILSTPALVVDGQVKAAGKIPAAAELDRFLT